MTTDPISVAGNNNTTNKNSICNSQSDKGNKPILQLQQQNYNSTTSNNNIEDLQRLASSNLTDSNTVNTNTNSVGAADATATTSTQTATTMATTATTTSSPASSPSSSSSNNQSLPASSFNGGRSIKNQISENDGLENCSSAGADSGAAQLTSDGGGTGAAPSIEQQQQQNITNSSNNGSNVSNTNTTSQMASNDTAEFTKNTDKVHQNQQSLVETSKCAMATPTSPTSAPNSGTVPTQVANQSPASSSFNSHNIKSQVSSDASGGPPSTSPMVSPSNVNSSNENNIITSSVGNPPISPANQLAAITTTSTTSQASQQQTVTSSSTTKPIALTNQTSSLASKTSQNSNFPQRHSIHHHHSQIPGAPFTPVVMPSYHNSSSASTTGSSSRHRQHYPLNPDNFLGRYRLIKTIGKGNFAKVKLAKHIPTMKEVAIKIIDKTALNPSSLKKLSREVTIMKMLDHPNIVKLYEVIDSQRTLYLVMEYASGGEVFDYLVAHGKMREKEARAKFRQIVSAVQYCHQKQIIHRDLKAENLLLDSQMNIKIADFGFSNEFVPGQTLDTFCGSPPYAAPELFKGLRYEGPEVDIWSLGVILYTLVSGTLPFDGNNLKELRERVLRGKYRIPFYMSTDCENLLKKFLVLNPLKRASLEVIMKDKWMNVGYEDDELRPFVEPKQNYSDAARIQALLKMGYTVEEVEESLRNRKYDEVMALYLLLGQPNNGNVYEQSDYRSASSLSLKDRFSRTSQSEAQQPTPNNSINNNNNNNNIGNINSANCSSSASHQNRVKVQRSASAATRPGPLRIRPLPNSNNPNQATTNSPRNRIDIFSGRGPGANTNNAHLPGEGGDSGQRSMTNNSSTVQQSNVEKFQRSASTVTKSGAMKARPSLSINAQHPASAMPHDVMNPKSTSPRVINEHPSERARGDLAIRRSSDASPVSGLNTGLNVNAANITSDIEVQQITTNSNISGGHQTHDKIQSGSRLGSTKVRPLIESFSLKNNQNIASSNQNNSSNNNGKTANDSLSSRIEELSLGHSSGTSTGIANNDSISLQDSKSPISPNKKILTSTSPHTTNATVDSPSRSTKSPSHIPTSRQNAR